jgi:hypothetical protein
LTKSDTDVDAPGLPGGAADPEAFYEAQVPEVTTIKTRQRIFDLISEEDIGTMFFWRSDAEYETTALV